MNIRATFYRENQAMPLKAELWRLSLIAFIGFWIPVPILNWVVVVFTVFYGLYRVTKLNRFVHHIEMDGQNIRVETYASPLWMKPYVFERPLAAVRLFDGELYTDDKGHVLVDDTTGRDYFIPKKFKMKAEGVENIEELMAILERSKPAASD